MCALRLALRGRLRGGGALCEERLHLGGEWDANCSLWLGFWWVTGWLRPSLFLTPPRKFLFVPFFPSCTLSPRAFLTSQPSGVETGQKGGEDS